MDKKSAISYSARIAWSHDLSVSSRLGTLFDRTFTTPNMNFNHDWQETKREFCAPNMTWKVFIIHAIVQKEGVKITWVNCHTICNRHSSNCRGVIPCWPIHNGWIHLIEVHTVLWSIFLIIIDFKNRYLCQMYLCLAQTESQTYGDFILNSMTRGRINSMTNTGLHSSSLFASP